MKLGSPAGKILMALRAAAEGERDERGFRDVHTDRALPDGMPRMQFAGYLYELEAEGMYQSIKGWAFGRVLT